MSRLQILSTYHRPWYQQKEDEVDSSNDVSKWREKDWEEKFPLEKNKKEDAGEE